MKQPPYILLLILTLMLSACATTQNHYDPIEPVNRVSDTINDTIDRISLKPAAQGYTAVVPKPMRIAVSNFFDNSTYLNTVLNDFLQGKGGQGTQDFLRFLINSTLGIGGLVDVASSIGFERHQEDFGQTLATWGMSQGAYLVYPLLGPNSVRDTPDILTATATDPLFWAGFALAPYITVPVAVLKYIDTRAQLLDASNMRDELALDPYVFTREAWHQNREFMIYDGHPPASNNNNTGDTWEDDNWEEDTFDTMDSVDSKDKVEASNMEKTAPVTSSTDIPKTRISLASAPVTQAQDIPALPNTDKTAALVSPSENQQGMYNIYLSSHYTEVEAAAEQARIGKLNIHTRIVPVNIDQHVWYRLHASSFHDQADAQAQLTTLRLRTGLKDAWMIKE